jgi:hypothetical protein
MPRLEAELTRPGGNVNRRYRQPGTVREQPALWLLPFVYSCLINPDASNSQTHIDKLLTKLFGSAVAVFVVRGAVASIYE